MREQWLEMRLLVPAEGVEPVGQILTDLGCSGLITEERRLDTFEPPDPDEAPSGPCRVRAFFSSWSDPPLLAAAVRAALAPLLPAFPGLLEVPPEIVPVAQADWAEGWKQHFGVVRIGKRLVVRPSWEEYRPAEGEAVVVLDPGMAFGTGTHGTTRLCLEVLAGLFESGCPPRRVLDVGTGSGILALAAAALGATRVCACDIDPDACRIAAENAAANHLTEQVEICDLPLAELQGEFDAVVANILAEELVRLAPALARRLAPAGTLILSGILREKEALVEAGFALPGLQGPEVRRLDEWSCLLYRKP